MESMKMVGDEKRVPRRMKLSDKIGSEPQAPLQGTMGLLWTVLSDGVKTYQDAIRRGSTRSEEFREAYRWIFSRDGEYLTSFSTLCSVFGIDSGLLRRELLEMSVENRPSRELRAG